MAQANRKLLLPTYTNHAELECIRCSVKNGDPDPDILAIINVNARVRWGREKEGPAPFTIVEDGNECFPCFDYRKRSLNSAPKQEVEELRKESEEFDGKCKAGRANIALGNHQGNRLKHERLDMKSFKTQKLEKEYADMHQKYDFYSLQHYCDLHAGEGLITDYDDQVAFVEALELIYKLMFVVKY